jgi:Cu2+-containing amine oxidase
VSVSGVPRIIWIPAGGRAKIATKDGHVKEREIKESQEVQKNQLTKPELLEDLSIRLQRLSKADVDALLNNEKPLKKSSDKPQSRYSEEEIREKIASLTTNQLQKIQTNLDDFEATQKKVVDRPKESAPLLRPADLNALAVSRFSPDRDKRVDTSRRDSGLEFSRIQEQFNRAKPPEDVRPVPIHAMPIEPIVEAVANVFINAVINLFQKSSQQGDAKPISHVVF